MDAEGYPVREETAALAANLIPAAEVRDLIPREHTQITDENGFYQWGVPEGLWFVTAEYAGLTGDSDGDSAAVIRALDRDLLPVLPPQLDVNIPLVDPSAPVVEAVRYTTEGVYVTFSKYMNEAGTAASVLSKGSYSVYSVSDDTELVITGIESVELGHSPANRDVDETTYTRTVLLRVDAPAEGTELRLTVAGTVESYAGTPMGVEYTGFGAAEAQETLEAPVITPASGTVERGSEVVITGSEGAEIRYTTDGSEPTRESPRYVHPFAVTNDVTIKAIAVRPGYANSAVAEASYTVATGVLTVAVRVVADDGGNADGLTLTLGGYSALVEGGVARFSGVQSGSYTLSFAGNDAYKPASASVTIVDSSVVLVLHLEKEDGTPEPEPEPEPGPSPGPDPTTPATEPITIPVSSEAGAISVTVTVSGNTATIGALSDSDISKIISDDRGPIDLVFDLSGLNPISTVKISHEMIAKIAKVLASHESEDTVTIRTKIGAVCFDETAIQAILAQGTGGAISLIFERASVDVLNAAQKAALDGKTVEAVYTLTLTVNGKAVTDFEGGTCSLPLLLLWCDLKNPFHIPHTEVDNPFTVGKFFVTVHIIDDPYAA